MKRAKIVHPFGKLFTNKIFLGESKWASRSSPMSILFRTSALSVGLCLKINCFSLKFLSSYL